MKPAQIAINTVSTRHASLWEAFAAYADAGFEAVELELPPAKDAGAERIRQLLDEHGLRCIGGFDEELCCFAGPAARDASIAGIVESARFVDELGGGIVVFGTDGPGARLDGPLDLVAEAVRHALDAVDGLAATLAIEFNWGPVVRSLQSAVAVADAVDHPGFGVLFDSAHYYTTPTKLEHLTPAAVGRVVAVHLNDMPAAPADLADCNDDRVLPGEGILPLGAIIELLEAGGYEGHFALELFSEDLWRLPVAEAARRSYASMISLCV